MVRLLLAHAAMLALSSAATTRSPPHGLAAVDGPASLPSLGVLAIFKNEAHGMVEWIEHYRAEGVSQFVLIDDNSTDGGDIIARTMGADVTVRPSTNGTHIHGDGNRQDPSYHAHVHLLTTDWMLVADMDEFVFARPRAGESNATIPQYLATVAEAECGAIVLPWVMFGSSNRSHHPVSVIDSCRYREADSAGEGSPERRGTTQYFQVGEQWRPGSSSWWVKTITRRSALCGPTSFNLHTSMTSTPRCLATHTADPSLEAKQGIETPLTCADYERIGDEWMSTATGNMMIVYPDGVPEPKTLLQMNHYPLQSWEWFCRIKATRGDAVGLDEEDDAEDDTYTTALIRDGAYYDMYNDIYSAERDDELAIKRGAAFFASLPVDRPWPPGSSLDPDCARTTPPLHDAVAEATPDMFEDPGARR